VAICQINLATEIPFSSPENDFFFKSVLLWLRQLSLAERKIGPKFGQFSVLFTKLQTFECTILEFCKGSFEVHNWQVLNRGCQMVYFQTKIPIWVNFVGP
jgi:hypothetical protein